MMLINMYYYSTLETPWVYNQQPLYHQVFFFSTYSNHFNHRLLVQLVYLFFFLLLQYHHHHVIHHSKKIKTIPLFFSHMVVLLFFPIVIHAFSKLRPDRFYSVYTVPYIWPSSVKLEITNINLIYFCSLSNKSVNGAFDCFICKCQRWFGDAREMSPWNANRHVDRALCKKKT